MEPAGSWLLELELEEDSPASAAAAAKTMSVRIIVLNFLSLLSRPLAPKGAVSSWRVAASLERCPDTKPESCAKTESLGSLPESERDAAVEATKLSERVERTSFRARVAPAEVQRLSRRTVTPTRYFVA